MDSLKRAHPLVTYFGGFLIFFALLGRAVSSETGRLADPYAAWDGTLTPATLTPFSPIVPFDSEYRFGWEGLGAGEAFVRIMQGQCGKRMITARGGPNSFIRKLWNYQASYAGESGANGETPAWFRLDESYPKGAIRSEAYMKEGSVTARHQKVTENKPWEVTRLPKVHDLFSAILFVRSQPLRDGDKLRIVVFPNTDPFLVDLTVVGRESILLQEKKICAIRFTLMIQTIEVHGANKGRLAPYKKFHSGRVWMSDDGRRLPLRAEVDLFVGKVFAEMARSTPPL